MSPMLRSTRSRLSKYVDAIEASRMLDGLLRPGAIRTLARRGLIPGAVLAPSANLASPTCRTRSGRRPGFEPAPKRYGPTHSQRHAPTGPRDRRQLTMADTPKPSVQEQIQARVKELQRRHLEQLRRDQERSRLFPDLFPSGPRDGGPPAEAASWSAS